MAKNTNTSKLTVFSQLLQNKTAVQNQRRSCGILGDDLSKRFLVGEKAQPKIRRGGRNGSGKP